MFKKKTFLKKGNYKYDVILTFNQEKAFLKWTKKVDIGFLTSELKRRKWIFSQHEFSRLFNDPDIILNR